MVERCAAMKVLSKGRKSHAWRWWGRGVVPDVPVGYWIVEWWSVLRYSKFDKSTSGYKWKTVVVTIGIFFDSDGDWSHGRTWGSYFVYCLSAFKGIDSFWYCFIIWANHSRWMMCFWWMQWIRWCSRSSRWNPWKSGQTALRGIKATVRSQWRSVIANRIVVVLNMM